MDIHRVTPNRWTDLESLFGPSGAASGCWCMWWRITAKEFDREAGKGLKRSFRSLVLSGPPPGLLAYEDGTPVGWVSLGARSEFGRLNRSPKLKPVDDEPVCSIVCFFIDRAHRRTGMAEVLLEAAVSYAEEGGYRWAEGYPIDTRGVRKESGSIFTGTLDLFTRAAFAEVERRGGRPIVRKRIGPRPDASAETR